MLNEKIVRELVAYSCGVQIPSPSTLCGYAAEVIEQLQRENEHLTEENRRMKDAAASAKSEKFSLQDFIRANLIPPKQRVCLCEQIDSDFARPAWSGPFCDLPQSYTQRAVDKVLVPISDAALECYRFTLYILLASET